MRISNPWIGYVQRSYQQIKLGLVTALKSKAPEITDYSENNPLIIILSMFSGLTEHLNYYIDVMAQELYITSARRFVSLAKLGVLLDYYSRGTTPSIVTIKIQLLDNANNLLPSTTSFTIPTGTVFASVDGSGVFITQKPYVIGAGISEFFIEALNYISGNTAILTNTATGLANQAYAITDPNYTDKTPTITGSGETYTLVKNLAFSKPTDKHFTVRFSDAGRLYVVFGDNVHGKIPPTGTLTLNYYKTKGSVYNNILPGLISTSPLDILALTTGPTNIVMGNLESPLGGADLETAEQLRIKIPASIRTLDRAVTYQDYQDLLQLVPGVEKGEADFCCNNGDGIILYVLPNGGGIANNTLLGNVEDFFDTRKMLNTKITAKPVKEVSLQLAIEAVVFSGQSISNTQQLIITTLQNEYNYLNQNINGSVRISDIITLISNLLPIDYIKTLTLWGKPKISGLLYNMTVNVNTAKKYQYRLLYQGSHQWVFYRDNTEIQTLTTGYTFDDSIIQFIVDGDGGIATGKTFEFTIYPYNKDIEITDFSIAVLDVATLDLTVVQNSNIGKIKNC